MSTIATTPVPRQSYRWIVSSWWDLLYIVVTPLLIVPVVLVLARHWLTAEQVSLAVIAFASLGHHLPGFMRAYGDRELFLRYRWRFLLVPPLIFSVALLFSPPTIVAEALGLRWTHLHGLELILLVWGTWHGLMQTYGFMRIYDVRLGTNDRWTARLDHWLCLCVFVAGVVFSDARVFGVANAMWQSGLPLFGPEVISWVRIVVGAMSIGVLAAYAFNLIRLRRQGVPLSWVKLLLIGTTGWFYWYTGRLSTNVLIGLAMFEIYHAIQYYAIVWIYNRRLFQRAGNRFGPLGFLFRDRWAMLGIYLAAIAAYSSIRYFTVDANAYVFRGGSLDAYQWLVALFVTSSFLHFYYDGFIWKVSEKNTQQNLVDDLSHTSIAAHLVPAFVHLGKLAILAVAVAGLLIAEYLHPAADGERKSERLRALSALTPQLPECQALLGRDALSSGDARSAIEHLGKALELRPRSHSLLADLGLAYMLDGQLERARNHLKQAMKLAPGLWEYHCDLGLVLAQLKQNEEAEQAMRKAVELAPEVQQPREHLAELYLRLGRDRDAEIEFAEIAKRFPKSLSGELGQVLLLSQQGKHEEAIELASFLSIGQPNNWRVQLAYGLAMLNSGEVELAIPALQNACLLRPQSASAHYHLGRATFLSGAYQAAFAPLQRATEIDPAHFEALLLQANTHFALGDADQALEAYTRCQQLQPQDAELCAKFGGLLALLERVEVAESVYRAGLAAHPEDAALNYNLGVLLWQQDKQDEARQLISKARQLGLPISAAVSRAVFDE